MSPFARRLAFTGLVVLLAGAAASAGVLLWRQYHPPRVQVRARVPVSAPAAAALLPGDPRPDFTLPDTDGRPRSVSEWDGKLLIVNFWATWCPPCLEEVPTLVRLQRDYGGSGVQVLGVALDSVENVRRFITEQGVNYPSLHGERDAIALGKRYGNSIGALPYTVVVGRDGRVLKTHHGILRERAIRRLIDSHS